MKNNVWIKGGVVAVLLGMTGLLSANASILTYSTTTDKPTSQLFSFSYDGSTITAGGVAGFSGSFTGGQAGDSFSWILTGATGWNSATAAASHADFNSYAVGLTYGAAVGGGKATTIGGVTDDKINPGEVFIFDFNVSGLVAGSKLTLIDTATGNATASGNSAGDWVLVDKVANTVVASDYNVSKGVFDFGGVEIQNSNYRLYYAGNTDVSNPGTFKVTSFAVDVIAVPEPATLGMVVAYGAGILFIRRRFKI